MSLRLVGLSRPDVVVIWIAASDRQSSVDAPLMSSVGVAIAIVRPRRGDSGFTLAEVMVVVLIIGILLGIGVPTFVGARERAADRGAQVSLRIASDTALYVSDFGADFTRADAAALGRAEPSQTFVSAATSAATGVVSVDHSRPGEWSAVIRSDSGRCFGVLLSEFGRQAYESLSCRASSAATESPSSSGYVAPPPALQTDGDATMLGVPEDGAQFVPNAEFTSDDDLFVFFESAQVLEAPLSVAGVTIPAGTSVCSHIVWFDPASAQSSVSATIDFGSEILVGIGYTPGLQATAQFELPGVNYDGYRWAWFDGDTFSAVGSVGQFKATASKGWGDMMRILTDCG